MYTAIKRIGECSITQKDSFVSRQDDHCAQERFGALCQFQERKIEPLGSCELHPKRDVEIITIVTKGQLEHKDSHGIRGTLGSGHIQYFSTKNNLPFLEHNPSPSDATELLQLWIIPREEGFLPRYEQRTCDIDRFNRWAYIISGNGRKNSLRISQDVTVRVSHLFMGHTLVSEPMQSGYGRILFILDGEVDACGHILKRRDELQVIGDEPFEITANRDAHLFLIDVPMRNFA
jgi:redox-sensitive bicupin YhaK (pirin superfamily)